jgi:hypothetical protein
MGEGPASGNEPAAGLETAVDGVGGGSAGVRAEVGSTGPPPLPPPPPKMLAAGVGRDTLPLGVVPAVAVVFPASGLNT